MFAYFRARIEDFECAVVVCGELEPMSRTFIEVCHKWGREVDVSSVFREMQLPYIVEIPDLMQRLEGFVCAAFACTVVKDCNAWMKAVEHGGVPRVDAAVMRDEIDIDRPD